MRLVDPSAMTEAARFAAIAELLARGIQRLFAHECKAKSTSRNPQHQLDAFAAAEAPCGPRVLSPRSKTA